MAYTNKQERHDRLMSDPDQPRRSLREVKEIALQELRKQGLSRIIDVKVTNDISCPFGRAEYIRNGNKMLLHPINRFATMNDIRQTVRHEISRYRDETRPDRTKEY